MKTDNELEIELAEVEERANQIRNALYNRRQSQEIVRCDACDEVMTWDSEYNQYLCGNPYCSRAF